MIAMRSCGFRRGVFEAFAAAFAFGGIAAEAATIDFAGAKESLAPFVCSNPGRIRLVREELTWNECGELALGAPATNREGFVVWNAVAMIGTDGKTTGFPVKGGRRYSFSIEVRGGVPSVRLSAKAWNEGLWKDSVNLKTNLKDVPVKGDWTLYRGIVDVPDGKTRLVLQLQMWSSTQYPPVKYKEGDSVRFDNVTFEEMPNTHYVAEIRERYERASNDAERSALRGRYGKLLRPFTVSVVSRTSDFAVPFVPKEAFEPPDSIGVCAAVNERTGVPVAIMNLTDAPETYVVRLETSTADQQKPWAEKQFDGEFGLSGFPQDRIEMRTAIRMKDSDNAPISLRLEQLAKMDEANSIIVQPNEAGLVWIDFDTTDVKAGVYPGRLRVIPLSRPAKWKSWKGRYHDRIYEGDMQDVPFSLEVIPVILPKEPSMPFGFFQMPTTKGQFDLMRTLGTRDFQISPWSFENDAAIAEEGKNVRNIFEWSKAEGMHPTFFIGFSAFHTFRRTTPGMLDADFKTQLEKWPDWIRKVQRTMNAWGVADADYVVEVYDEPDPKIADDIMSVLSAAKAAAPGIRLALTLGAHVMDADTMRRFAPCVDTWILWSHGYFRDQAHLAFIAETCSNGGSVWHYTCSTSGRAPVYETYRLHPWFGWAHRLTGNQFFIFQEMTGGFGPYDFKCAMSSGIAYRNFNVTMPSLRYMALRRGVYDVKYLEALAAARGGDPDVKAFLERAPMEVLQNRHDTSTPDRIRDEAIRLLLQPGK